MGDISSDPSSSELMKQPLLSVHFGANRPNEFTQYISVTVGQSLREPARNELIISTETSVLYALMFRIPLRDPTIDLTVYIE